MTASSVSNENRLYHKKQLVWVPCEMIQERQKRTARKVSGNRQEERLCVTGSLTKSLEGVTWGRKESLRLTRKGYVHKGGRGHLVHVSGGSTRLLTSSPVRKQTVWAGHRFSLSYNSQVGPALKFPQGSQTTLETKSSNTRPHKGHLIFQL